MVRRGAPALYELMRKPSGGAPSAPAPPKSAARNGSGPSLPDSFEVSLGRAVLIGVGVVIAISLAYGIGLRRGGRQAESGEGQSPSSAAAQPVPDLRGASGAALAASDRPVSVRASASSDEPSAANNNGDPRIKGRWYYVIAHPSSKRAQELVDFCRRHGLEAHRVPDNNALSRKIIVLPDFREPSDKSSPEIKALRQRIEEVGQKWKAAGKGNSDFSTAYPEQFR